MVSGKARGAFALEVQVTRSAIGWNSYSPSYIGASAPRALCTLSQSKGATAPSLLESSTPVLPIPEIHRIPGLINLLRLAQGPGWIDSSAEMRRVQPYIISIIGVRVGRVEVDERTRLDLLSEVSAGQTYASTT